MKRFFLDVVYFSKEIVLMCAFVSLGLVYAADNQEIVKRLDDNFVLVLFLAGAILSLIYVVVRDWSKYRNVPGQIAGLFKEM